MTIFARSEKENPFVYKYKEILNHTLNIEAMRKASEYLVGTHDLQVFLHLRLIQENLESRPLRALISLKRIGIFVLFMKEQVF